MSTISATHPLGRHAYAGTWSTVETRLASLARLVAWSVATAAIGGAVVGWILAIHSGMRFRSIMGFREWCDALSYSGLTHAVIMMAYGLALSTVVGILAVLSPRIARLIRPGRFATSAFLAALVPLFLWSSAVKMQLGMATGIQKTWSALMLFLWLLAFLAAYRLASWLASRGFARFTARSTTFVAGVCTLLLCAGAVVQWFEAPRMLGPELALPAAAPVGDVAYSKPNVVLIVMDTQRVDRLGCYGYERPTTPKIDAFAEDAHVFENVTSAAGWTLPSHASIFTGLFPSEHGTHRNHRWLDDDFVTMAELLRQNGYQTAAFSNNLYISDTCNMVQGFDEVCWPSELHEPRGSWAGLLLQRVLKPAGLLGTSLLGATNEDAGGKFTGQLVRRWLETRDRQQPFFLFVNLLEAHAPYEPHLAHRKVFMDREELDRSYELNWKQKVPFSLLKRDCYSADDLTLLNRTYDAETRMLDDYVGSILESIARQAGLDNTLIILTSDHGENLGDHHMMSHQWCVYDTLIHVPLIIRFPSRIRPGRTQGLVQTIDLLPTVMDAVHGRPVPTASTFGRSLFSRGGNRISARRQTCPGDPVDRPGSTDAGKTQPATTSQSLPRGRVVLAERIEPLRSPLAAAQRIDCHFDRTPYLGVLRSIRQGDWKYIRHADGREELYNVALDPGETDNRLPAERRIADHLADRLREWLAACNAYGTKTAANSGPSMDPTVRKRLRNLGYIH